MSTASAPSRFWGVVALALNSVLQPTGQICGGITGSPFLSGVKDSPFLRLSPPFQLVNAFCVIIHILCLTFASGLPFRKAVGVAATRVGLYQNVSGLERRAYFRAGVFVFGALPSLIKALAIQGDLVSYSLALGFFVPFVVLEAIDLAALPAEAAHGMPAETDLDWCIFRLYPAAYALCVHINLCLIMVHAALAKSSMFRGGGAKPQFLIIMFSPLAATIGFGSLKIYESAPKGASFKVGMLSGAFGVLHVLMSIRELGNEWGSWSELATEVSAIAIALAGTLAHLFIYLCITWTPLPQFFSGQDGHQQKFMEQSIALWTITCIFLYYGYLYHASGTYKPAWTEWLP